MVALSKINPSRALSSTHIASEAVKADADRPSPPYHHEGGFVPWIPQFIKS